MLQDKPTDYPTTQADGSPLKPFTEAILERRATQSFLPDEVPQEYLDAILRFGTQAPSGYNLQPWRFVVVRDAENRRRLQQVAFRQAKVAEAPVVVIAVGMKEEWKETAGEVFREGAARGAGNPATVEQYSRQAVGFVSTIDAPKWVTRQTMIALTTMMYAAEVYGFDTAPMEGFDAEGVKREFGIPEEGEVVALLAIGRGREPDKPYTGRFPLSRVVYAEQFGEAWPDASQR
ncbi:MAG TPA: nitroreductase family protein [Pyrinomonadaceae bacterium]|nr:nitroreductase family protein [Pyrinomonadaceae bacterium]